MNYTRPNFSVTQVTNMTKLVQTTGSTATYPVTLLGVSETYTGNTRRRKPAGGFIPPTAYSFRRTWYKHSFGVHEYQNFYKSTGQAVPGTLTRWSGYPYGAGTGNAGLLAALTAMDSNNPLPTAFSSSLQDKAIVQARLAVKNQKVNLGNAFGERDQCAAMIGSNLRFIAESIDAVRDLNLTKLKRLGYSRSQRIKRYKSAFNRFLEVQYGWKPLLSDIHGAVSALASRPSDHWMVTAKGTSKSEWSKVSNHSNGTNSAYTVTGAGMEGCFVRIDAIPTNDPLVALSALGITNPASIAWELTPFSFVLDWALPIGDYLQSLDAMLGYGPTHCSVSRLHRLNQSATPYGGQWSSGSNTWSRWTPKCGPSQREYVYLSRLSLGTVPLPTLPRFHNPVSFGHMANGFALLGQAIANASGRPGSGNPSLLKKVLNFRV